MAAKCVDSWEKQCLCCEILTDQHSEEHRPLQVPINEVDKGRCVLHSMGKRGPRRRHEMALQSNGPDRQTFDVLLGNKL